jgi:threonine/homoserine/homoserine lactone efflux protein
MTFQLWFVFAITELLLSLTPGPAVLLVVSTGMKSGAALSRCSAAGILFTNACYFTLSALGLGAALLASQTIFAIVRWLGVVYLVYLGVKLIWHAKDVIELDTLPTIAAKKTKWQTFTQGVALQAGNPKAILFFVALLPQFVVTETAVAPQFFLLGVTSIVQEAIVLVIYGILAAKASRQIKRPHMRILQEQLSGVMLVAAAVGLSLVKSG